MICFKMDAGQLGINLNYTERGGTFIDLVKGRYSWYDVSGSKTLTNDQIDTNGWPTCDASYITDFRPSVEWKGTIDDPQIYRINMSGIYTGSFSGSATISSLGNGKVKTQSYDTKTNTTTFRYEITGPVGAGHGFFILKFTDTKKKASSPIGSGITHFKLLHPGYKFNDSQIFTTPFINSLKKTGFTTIRFMNFTGTNNAEPVYPAVTMWKNRKLLTDASQSRIPQLGKNNGAAWQYVIKMANTLKVDVWINIPVSATTDYIQNCARLFKDNLDKQLNVYVESSNEVWNTMFNQTAYNKAQAEAKGLTEHENHARRTIELAQIFKNVFGANALNKRVRVMLCSHKPMLKFWVEPMLQYINKTFGNPHNYIYAIACQTYFTGGKDEGESVEKIIADCRLSITQQIDEKNETNEAGRKQWFEKAAKWKLIGGFCSYEGGPDHGGGSTTNLVNRIKAERSKAMAEEMKYNLLDGFFNLGGNLAVHYKLSSGYSRYGCWGLTDDISNLDRNYKFQAMREVIDSLRISEKEN